MDARKTVVLCVTGGIAAYKAAEIARGLLGAGLRVLPVMTARATEFLGAQTLAGLTGEPVRQSMWDASFAGEMHVALAKSAALMVIAPATADVLARLATGRADDLVTTLALVSDVPIVIAPSMHPSMWAHPATQRNVAQLAADGRSHLVGPVDGPVASGESGLGRMAEAPQIVEAALGLLAPRDLAGAHIVVTAGPTVEDIDPVRFLSNRSSGQMGFAVARSAAQRGARVTLVAGPVPLATPRGVQRIDVRGALAMRDALGAVLGLNLESADALVMTAAVSDFRPADELAVKQKRGAAASAALPLVQNPDVLAEIGNARGSARRPVLVGFAVETDADALMIASARGKLRTKGVDIIVVNHAADALGRADNRAILVTETSHEALGVMAKDKLADHLLDRVRALLGSLIRPVIAAFGTRLIATGTRHTSTAHLDHAFDQYEKQK